MIWKALTFPAVVVTLAFALVTLAMAGIYFAAEALLTWRHERDQAR